MRSGKTTLKDVAARAGVSPKTVSNVVNGYEHVTPETRSRVEAALEELGYRPNLSARHLRRGASGIIALVVPELDVPYFAELARHVIRAAAERSLTVIIDQTDGDPERERVVLEGDRALLLDGLILSPLGLAREDLERRRDGTPLVLLGEHISGGPVDHVWIDNVAAAREATRHLLSLGRRRIAAIGDQPYEHGETAQLRTRGFVTALQEAGIAPDQRLIVPVPASTASRAPVRWRRCSRSTIRRTRSSPSTTWSRSARCASRSRGGCACPRTWRSPASTTSRTGATARRR